MKRLFFILAAVMMTASVMVSCTKSQKTTEQEITFMGIPVSYPYDQFSAELSQKVQPEDVFEQEALYTGTFAEIDNCRIGVVQAEDGSIDLIAVDKTQGFETADIMKLKRMYDDKYGHPIEVEQEPDYAIYTYRAGDTKIELGVDIDRSNPDRFTAFIIIYRPGKYKNLSSEDI